MAYVQNQLEKLVENNYYLYNAARDAFKSYLHAYKSHSLREVFEVKKIDLLKTALSFGMRVPPRVDLDNGIGNVKEERELGGRRMKKQLKGRENSG